MDEDVKQGIDKALEELIKNGCQPEFDTSGTKRQFPKAGEAWTGGGTTVVAGDPPTVVGYVHTSISPCCVCVGSCNHTGPHQFCPVHGANLQTPVTPVQQPLNPVTPPNLGLTGWKCPVCGAGVSPYATVCPNHQSNTSPFQVQPWPWNPNQFFD